MPTFTIAEGSNAAAPGVFAAVSRGLTEAMRGTPEPEQTPAAA